MAGITIPMAIKNYLEADSTLSGLVTYFYTPEDLGRFWLELNDVRSGSSPLIQPTIFVRVTSGLPYQVTALNAEELYLGIWVITHEPTSIQVEIREQVDRLLDQHKINTFTVPTNYYMLRIINSGRSFSSPDDSLAGAEVSKLRYRIHLRRND